MKGCIACTSCGMLRALMIGIPNILILLNNLPVHPMKIIIFITQECPGTDANMFQCGKATLSLKAVCL
jgi:hypothetical protein